MRVVVTGSSGKIGRAAIGACKAAGHRVTPVDLKPSPDGLRTIIADCADLGEILGIVSGVDTHGPADAVLHLAGIPAPGIGSDARTFDTNLRSTYNVFTAAARAGITRIVWASSETILGLPFDTPPAYLPLDENAPDHPCWSYALAKQLGETMADAFCRWHPAMTIVSLRFSNVYDAADYAALAAIQADSRQRRANLWSYVDARDAGEACRLALEAPILGHQRYIIAAPDTVMAEPTAALVAAHFPGVPQLAPLEGQMALLSSARASAELGYAPCHGWRSSTGDKSVHNA